MVRCYVRRSSDVTALSQMGVELAGRTQTYHIPISRDYMQHLFGKHISGGQVRYLDCYTSAGTFNLGRSNESIAESFKNAIYETDQGNIVMPSDYKTMLARRLSDFVPGKLDAATEDLAKKFCSSAKQGGILVNTGRVDTTTVLIRPSLLIGTEEIGRMVSVITKTVEEI